VAFRTTHVRIRNYYLYSVLTSLSLSDPTYITYNIPINDGIAISNASVVCPVENIVTAPMRPPTLSRPTIIAPNVLNAHLTNPILYVELVTQLKFAYNNKIYYNSLIENLLRSLSHNTRLLAFT